MRKSWEQIQDEYKNKWVLLQDMDYNGGNLISAIVTCARKKRGDINRFEKENPHKVQRPAAVKYTGEPVGDVEMHYDGF